MFSYLTTWSCSFLIYLKEKIPYKKSLLKRITYVIVYGFIHKHTVWNMHTYNMVARIVIQLKKIEGIVKKS